MSSSQKSNFSLVVYISRTKTKKNGEVPVLMKININGERVVMQLQRSVHPNNWDSTRAKVEKTLKLTPVRRSNLTPPLSQI